MRYVKENNEIRRKKGGRGREQWKSFLLGENEGEQRSGLVIDSLNSNLKQYKARGAG